MNKNRLIFVILAAFLLSFGFLGLAGRSLADSALNRDLSPTPTPSPAPKPSATPSPVSTPVAIQSIDELQTKIRQRMFAPEVRRGRVGIKIVSLNSGKVVFENDSDKYFMPASNMKNFTVSTALERLGPDFKFVTSVYAGSLPDASGTVKGDLRIFGRGDISISTAFFGTSPTDPETYYKGIDRLVERISAAGVKRIEGSIVGDESYFKGFAIPGTWEWDDLQSYYGAEISALPLNDNAIDISVAPGNVGGPCTVTISPANKLVQVTNLCTTAGPDTPRNPAIVKKLDRNIVEVSGTMPTGKAPIIGSIAFTHPSNLFVAILKQRLESKGIAVTGDARVLPANVAAEQKLEIAKLESPPLSIIAAKTLKPSQNMYTETILWTLGENFRPNYDPTVLKGARNPVTNSSDLGLMVVKAFLAEVVGIPDDGIMQYDGSGLSRHDLITPSAVVTLYTYMAKKSRYAQVWRDSLTIGGVDGTLANRFKGTAAAGNIRGKTGTIDQVSALSGYMTTAGGEQLVLSMVVNGVAETRTRTMLMDDIVVSLANFNGKIDQ